MSNARRKPVCTIIGMGPGLGFALARRFAREGYFIAMVARREDQLHKFREHLVREDFECAGFAADAENFGMLRSALMQQLAECGPSDVLIYNAAQMTEQKPSQLSPEQLLQSFQVNVAGALCAVQSVLPGMRESNKGTLLFTGGGFAFEPYMDYAALGVGKAGIRNLALSLFQEFEGTGVHCATVTVCGSIRAGTRFDPDTIADEYWKLHLQAPGRFEKEVIFK